MEDPANQDQSDGGGEGEANSTSGAPRTWRVVCVLVVAALLMSYLGAYAVTNALVAAELLTRWPPGHDPRPMRMCTGFVIIMTIFTVGAATTQLLSRRQIKRIDEMENE